MTRKKLDNESIIIIRVPVMMNMSKKFISGSLFSAAVLLLCTVPLFSDEYSTEDFLGTWKLLYSGGFGYEFRFKENYRAYVIIYLQSRVVVFRGIYAIDDGDTIRINISDMKEQKSKSGFESDKGFVKTSASVFLFRVGVKKDDELVLYRKKIHIDGRSSEGYFEETIALKKK